MVFDLVVERVHLAVGLRARMLCVFDDAPILGTQG